HAPTHEDYTLSLHDALPIWGAAGTRAGRWTNGRLVQAPRAVCAVSALDVTKTARLSFDHGHHPDHAKTQRPPDRRGSGGRWVLADRKSTRLNSSHVKISYAV